MPLQANKPTIYVVAGVLVDSNDEILIAKRQAHQDQAGLWEFPGGKREVGENAFVALRRELAEELDIEVSAAASILVHPHEYLSKVVHLEFFAVTAWHGQARGAEGQEVRWVAKNQLADFQFPAANNIIVARLTAADFTGRSTVGQMEYPA